MTTALLQIGPYTLPSKTLLAPMAGITDLPFRELCLSFGAGLAVSEMVTSDSSLWHTPKSSNRLALSADKHISSVQLAGNDPALIAEAAKKNVAMGAQIIDINMGCPAKKVCKKAAGSALLKDELLVEQILTAVVNAVSVPVTLKIRTGWCPQSKNSRQIARIAEQAGIKALSIHGRTRACRFNGEAEYDSIAEVVQSVSIPVIANGDIRSAEKAKQVLEYTGAAGVMIGRGAQGNPWIFQQINQLLATGKIPGPPNPEQIFATLSEHVSAIHLFYGIFSGVRIARKHIGWYLGRFPEYQQKRSTINQIDDPGTQLTTLQYLLEKPGFCQGYAL